MSYYEDERRRYKTKERSRRDDYDDGYDARDSKSTTLVRRSRDDSASSVEEVTRDFPPGEKGGAYYRETTVRKQGHRPVGRSRSFSDDYYYDDRYDDRSTHSRRRRDDSTYVSKRRSKYDDRDDRRSRRYDSYSDYSSRSRSRSPPKKERRKSTTEEVLKSLGLGGIAGAVLGKKSSSRSRSRDRGGRSRSRRGRSSSSSRSRGGKGKKGGQAQVTEALKAALLAGVGEAVRARKEPGGWGGDKGKRVLTAAISAGGVDGILSHNRGDRDHGTRDVIGSAIAGMATNRIVNGPRSKSRGRNGSPDSRTGRSQSRGGIGDLAAGGVLAATGKKLYDKVRSRSRGRDEEDRGRGRSRDSSYDSYSRSPPPRKRSQSVSAGLAKGLSAVGLGSVADKVDPERRKSRGYDDYDDRSSRNGGYRDSRDVGPLAPYAPAPASAAPAGYGPGPVPGAPRSLSGSRAPGGQYGLDFGPHHTGDPQTDSDSDLGSSSGEEKEQKKSKKKGLLTAGLATVATIHAGHNVYQSMEKREARRTALKEGDISQAQAKREKNKARLQDVASLGIAALGIKGAYSEWQEMREHSHSIKESKEKIERHKEKREARRRKAALFEAERYKQSGYSGSMPNLAPQGGYYGDDAGQGPPTHYYDDNPYGAYSTPPRPPPGAAYTPPPHHEPPPGAGFPPPPGAAYTPPPSQPHFPPGPAYTPPPPRSHDDYIPPPPMGPARSETR